MLLTELILSKKGPLAKVWLSAHHERKLSKAQALQVDVGETVEAILEEQAEPLALRMSGQLMLGVVRIYSRKAQYLMDDCKDVRDKITMAFRPGQVDLPADQLIAPRSAITNLDARNDFDLFLSDFQWDFAKRFPQAYRPREGAAAAVPGDPSSINLPQGQRHLSLYAASASGTARSRSGSVLGGGSERGGAGGDGMMNNSASGIRSNQYEEEIRDEEMEQMDLGLDFGGGEAPYPDAAADDSLEIEYGRDRQIERAGSVASSMRLGVLHRDGRKRSGTRDGSVESDPSSELTALPLDPAQETFDLGFGDDVLGGGADGMDVDQSMDMVPDMVRDDDEMDPDRARRETSRLTTPPPLDEISASTRLLLGDLTPQTAARIAKVAERQERLAAAREGQGAASALANNINGVGARRAGKVRAWRADEQIELAEGESLGRRDVSAILGKENYLPSSRAMLTLMRIQEDPAAYYLPTIERDGQTYFLTGSTGIDHMAPELVDLFMVPTNVLRRNKHAAEGEAEEGYARKKPRLAGPAERGGAGEEDEDEVEIGRRGGSGLSGRMDESGLDLDMGAGGVEGFDLDNSHDLGDLGGGGDDPLAFDQDIPFDLGSPADSRRQAIGKGRAVSPGLTSRAGSVMPISQVGGIHHQSAEGCLIAMFDTRIRQDRAGGGESQQSQVAGSQYSGGAAAESQATGTASTSKNSGLGKNTLFAIDVLRADVQAEGDKTSFEKLSAQASRRAAASFFFELLVLGTKDAVKLGQQSAYGDIAVEAKSKLWTLATEEGVAA